MCSRNSPYSLNCHVGAMLVFRMLCRITQSSDAHRTESVSVMDHEQTMGLNSRVLDQKLRNIFGRISLFWSVELQGHPEQLNAVTRLQDAINELIPFVIKINITQKYILCAFRHVRSMPE